MNKIGLLLPLATLILAPSCIADKSSKLDPGNQQSLKRYIIDGIKHHRLSAIDAAVEITFQSPELGKIVGGPAQSASAQKYDADSPNASSAQVYWIAKNGNLSFDVKLKGNLAADHGDKSWYLIEDRLIVWNGSCTTLSRSRMRTPDSNKGYKEKYAWSGNVNVQSVLKDRTWDEYYQLDPRYFAYFVDGRSLDQLLKNKTYSSKVVDIETLFGSRCAQVEVKKLLPDGSVFKIQCWVDLDHDFIVRKTRATIKKPQQQEVFCFESSVSTLLKIGSGWLPGSYLKHLFLPGKTAQGKKQVFDMVDRTTIEPIPSSYEWGTAPFTVHWPDGADVRDIPHNKEYRAQKDGTLKLVAN